MSYEFRAEGDRLNLPNPFRVENLFRFISAGIQFLGGLACLLISRHDLAARNVRVLGLVIGVGLILMSLNQARIAMTQLRFYFGRGQPVGLAPELLDPTQAGISDKGKALEERMRSGALWFREPVGALNGLLYSFLPGLIYSPDPIRRLAESQFQSAITILVTLFSFAIGTVSIGNANQRAWVSLIFFGFTLTTLVKPMREGPIEPGSLGIRGFVILLLVAIFAPILVPMMGSALPDISWLNLTLQTFVILLLAAAAVGLFFAALFNQIVAPPKTSLGAEVVPVSLNGQPKQMMDELERQMQLGWVEQIPNRRYARVLPLLKGVSGSFSGQLMEETQPLPREDMRGLDLKTALTQPRFAWLVYLNLLGLAITLCGVASLMIFAGSEARLSVDRTGLSWAVFGGMLLTVGAFCLRAGHMLWARFDFVSKLIWVQFDGNFQRSQVSVGAQFSDRVRSQNDVISINDMSLRVWVAELDTVTFGRVPDRLIVGMRGLPDDARQIRQMMEQSAANQSVVVAPTSQRDLEKIALAGQLNQLGGASTPPAVALQGMAAQVIGSINTKQFCPRCGQPVAPTDRFCGSCGAGVTA